MKGLRDGSMKIILWMAGIASIVLAVVYFTIPSESLPMPDILGHQAGSPTIHVKHGVAALLVGVVCLLLAWRVPSSRSEGSHASF